MRRVLQRAVILSAEKDAAAPSRYHTAAPHSKAKRTHPNKGPLTNLQQEAAAVRVPTRCDDDSGAHHDTAVSSPDPAPKAKAKAKAQFENATEERWIG